MQVAEYVKQFPLDEKSDRRKVVRQVVDKMVHEAVALALSKNSKSKSSVHSAFNQVRGQFEKYIRHYKIFSESKLKFFDAVSIPIRNSMIEKKDPKDS